MNQELEAKKRVQEQFGKNADKYITSEKHARGDDLELMLAWLDPQPHWIVLDIATGGGHVARKLSNHVRQVIATDLTRQMLAAAANHLREEHCDRVLLMEADAERLPFMDDSFDAVTCRIAAHHFLSPDCFMHEAARVLKPGGKFFFVDNAVPEEEHLARFMNQFEKMRDVSHVRCLSVRDWTTLSQEAGLHLERAELKRKTYPFPVWVRRTAETEEQAQQVERFICQADPHIREYFSAHIVNGRLESLQVDEWRALFCKY